MKKVLLAAIVLVGLSTVASAQVKFGLKGGISMANAKYEAGNTTVTFNSIVTPNLGVTVDFKGSDKFNIQSGLSYNGYGGKSSDNNTSIQDNIGALSIPVLAKYQLGSNFYGYAGPQISFVVSAKAKEVYNGNSTEIDIKDNVKSTSLFGVFGAGYKFQENIGAYAEYHAGLTNVDNSNNSTGTFKLNAFSFGLTYSF